MPDVIDFAVRPRFSDRASLTVDDGVVRIEDGTYRAEFPARAAETPDLTRLAHGVPPQQLLSEVGGWLGCGEREARAAVQRLFSTGLLVDPDAARQEHVPGAYVACRLLDVFRRRFPAAVRDAPLLRALAEGPNPGLALGFLVETYFVVRSARWSSEPVFRHDMTGAQRAALEDFRDSESGHGELLLSGFAFAGLDVDVLRRAPEAVETMAYSHAYGAFAWQGVAQFAAALVLPEVPAPRSGGTRSGDDVLDLLARDHGVPDRLIKVFRAHEDDDVEGDHAGLPALLLSEERHLTPAVVEHLFVVLRQMIDLYRGHLDAVHRRYARWTPDAAAARLPDNAFRV
ncbi:hypothetical protein ACFYY8_17325 [Streptosporangium sp. NPDC001559]|uniref:hypothetical protein n=1 Tax=Streptosporangium sp. NPDC001559 TaxID=3366187 RepID=UPI0036E20292